MSVPVATEEVRILVEGAISTGQWDFPANITPPHPLALILHDGPDRDLDGQQPSRPGLRPFLELSQALLHAGIATFRFVPPPDRDITSSVLVAWSRATQHVLVSRQRVGLVVVGEAGWRAVAPTISAMRTAAESLAAILIAPDGEADLTALDGIPSRVLAYDDLTEDLQSSADRIAGRALPHPELLTDVATNLAEMLRPRWERTIRPPGTAIG